MKARNLFRPLTFILLLAFLLILTGTVCGIRTFEMLEKLALRYEENEVLMESLRATVLYTVLSGSMLVSGVGIFLVTFLHIIRGTARIHKEAEALRKKNDAMEALNRQIQQLAHHQRLETIGTLTSSISHEFNNLLTPIMGYSMMALEKLPPEEGLYDDLLEIYQASCKAKTIISRLSDLSRKNTDTTFRLVAPDDVIRKTLDVANPAKPETVEVKLNLSCWDQRIYANEIQLSQLMLNLLLNSFHAMEGKQGILTVETSFDERFIHIQVADNGCGIPEKYKDKIFEPFFTTKETGKGTGLGLAIAAQMVEDHKGKIRLESSEGKGTRFLISLPRSRERETEESSS